MIETDLPAKKRLDLPTLDCLLVEDDPLIRLCLETIVREAGDTVTIATDGERAIEILKGHVFDLVISDIRMPHIDGWGVFRHVRETAPETDVILMTAYATVPDALAALKLGACDYLPKPVDAEELNEQLQTIRERRAARKNPK